MDRQSTGWDRKWKIEKDRRKVRSTKREKKIDVRRFRMEWDRKGEFKIDRQEFRLTKT